MKMKLYSSPTSPFARRVRVVAAELGLTDLIEEINVDPHSSPAELLAVNPLSKVPTLVTERGETLPDSALIIEYLLTRGRGLSGLPRGSKRWAALRRQHLAEGVTYAAVAVTMEKRRPESIIYTAFVDRQTALVQRALEALNLEVAQFEAEVPSVAEITIACALSYLDLRMPYLEWRKSHEALAAWHEEFCKRASMVRSQPPV